MVILIIPRLGVYLEDRRVFEKNESICPIDDKDSYKTSFLNLPLRLKMV